MNAKVYDQTVWLPVAIVARDHFNKTRQTVTGWCRDGFILTLGYRCRRTEKGYWLLAKAEKQEHTSIAH
jgi:hypothetical protein